MGEGHGYRSLEIADERSFHSDVSQIPPEEKTYCACVWTYIYIYIQIPICVYYVCILHETTCMLDPCPFGNDKGSETKRSRTNQDRLDPKLLKTTVKCPPPKPQPHTQRASFLCRLPLVSGGHLLAPSRRMNSHSIGFKEPQVD